MKVYSMHYCVEGESHDLAFGSDDEVISNRRFIGQRLTIFFKVNHLNGNLVASL